MRPGKQFDRGLILVAVIVVVVIVVGVIIFLEVRTDAVEQLIEAEENVDLLVIVHDNNQVKSAQAVFANTVTYRGALVDIPTNTGVLLDSLDRIDRIDTVFQASSPGAFRGEVEQLLGIELPYYLVLSTEQLSAVVDLAGGIELFLIDPIEVNDPTILIPAGNVLLDGQKTVDYLRYAPPNERPLEGVGRRQRLVQSLLARLGEQAEYLGRRDVFSLFRGYVETNLDARATTSLLEMLSELDTDTLIKQRVIGSTRNVEVAGETRDLLFPHMEGQLLKSAVQQVLGSIASPEMPGELRSVVRLEILNGTTTNGLARRTQELYEGFGYTNISVGNADSNDIEETTVINRLGDPTTAERVAEIIGADRIVSQAQLDDDVDVTIILGRDFDGVSVQQ